ncbi:MAG: DJ-1/PfpI family protein [Candidatus Micrarchaeia archaeon]|jgi:protease I
MSKALIVIAPKDFRDEELNYVRTILQKNGVETKVTSFTNKECYGEHGAVLRPEIKAEEINPKEFDGIIIIGGEGVEELRMDSFLPLLNLLKQFEEEKKLIAAFSEGVSVILKANIVKEKRVAIQSESLREMVEKYKGIPTSQAFVESANLITATKAAFVSEVAKRIAQRLSE